MKYLLIISTFLYSFSTFALGPDTALMIQLVSTTASQLNELERLVSNTEKYTKRMREYNELYEDQNFRAQRVLYLAESMASKKNIEGLGDLNNSIRDLKYTMEELRERMRDYGKIKEDEKKTEVYVTENKKLNELSEKQAKIQVAHSINAKTSGRADQLTAQNTALMYENQLKMEEIQLEMLKTQKTANRLKAEELEDKRIDEMNRLKFYGQSSNGFPSKSTRNNQ
ncbi:hypothetical protein SHI21_19605 [Bacteriovorax sp. PP10]|uniref:P-type conjugative transfer protein TrbJ n=1 Tax=Bacteriovorax antarcticus TaxID=3088717 RepID=A0ABU5VZS3_9BACT|nr:hypothetical protein [Bacteriovorax sp. PP10]MEA9358452.1 hypothetical protein [Bacteriovorax sp. PP10]